MGLFHIRNFRLLFGATALTNLGDGVLRVALPWFATTLTRDPVLIGMVAMARDLPWFFLALPAGVLTDRWDHRRTILVCDALRIMLCLCTAALAIAPIAGPAGAFALAALAFGLGAAEVLRDNTAQTFLPSLIPIAHLEKANGLLWSTEQLAGQFLGPPLAGALIGLGLAVAFGFNATALGFAVALLLLVRPPVQPRTPDHARPAFMTSLREGLGWLWAHPAMRRLAFVLGGFNFVASILWGLMVLYAQEVLGLGAAGYGLMLSALAVGGLLGSVTGPELARRFGATRCLLTSLAVFTLASAVMAATNSVWLTAGILTLEAYTSMVWNIITVSYRQRTVPPALLGRVNAAYRFIGTGPSAFGGFLGGVIVAVSAPLGANALHVPYAVAAVIAFGLLVFAARHLRLD